MASACGPGWRRRRSDKPSSRLPRNISRIAMSVMITVAVAKRPGRYLQCEVHTPTPAPVVASIRSICRDRAARGNGNWREGEQEHNQKHPFGDPASWLGGSDDQGFRGDHDDDLDQQRRAVRGAPIRARRPARRSPLERHARWSARGRPAHEQEDRLERLLYLRHRRASRLRRRRTYSSRSSDWALMFVEFVAATTSVAGIGIEPIAPHCTCLHQEHEQRGCHVELDALRRSRPLRPRTHRVDRDICGANW